MSLLAESLVEEWLNRAGYFTIRGARFGVREMDLLAVRQGPSGLEGRHVECQVSTNPIGYISPLTDAQSSKLGKKKTSVWVRPPSVLKASVSAWVDKKFRSPLKAKARDRAWENLTWSLELVHGAVRYPIELDFIRAEGISIVPFHSILESLCRDVALAHKEGAGTDIAEILAYYVEHRGPAA